MAILAVGLVAALLLIVTEFTTIASVDVASGACEEIADPDKADRCELSGLERHGGAFILFGLIVGVMAVGASAARARPAAIALVAIGVIVIIWSLVFDLPVTSETGGIGPFYSNATAHKEAGLYLEIVAGGLAMLAGAMRLTSREPEPTPSTAARPGDASS